MGELDWAGEESGQNALNYLFYVQAVLRRGNYCCLLEMKNTLRQVALEMTDLRIGTIYVYFMASIIGFSSIGRLGKRLDVKIDLF